MNAEAAGLVLEIAKTKQVFETLFHRLDRAVHHRRRRPEPGAVRLTHHGEPFVRGGFVVAIQNLADAIDEDFRPAAWNVSSLAATSRAITWGTGSRDNREM